jgi:hypothetical protein
MPFRAEFDNLYKTAIRPTLSDLGFEPIRADDRIISTDILCKICHLIQESSVNIVDISAPNPNVFLELGLIFGIGRDVILIKKSKSKVVTDILGLGFVPYDKYDAFQQQLRIAIWQRTGARSLKDKLCPTCGKRFSSSDTIYICVQDQAPHHQRCWQGKGCSVCKNLVDYIEVLGSGTW